MSDPHSMPNPTGGVEGARRIAQPHALCAEMITGWPWPRTASAGRPCARRLATPSKSSLATALTSSGTRGSTLVHVRAVGLKIDHVAQRSRPGVLCVGALSAGRKAPLRAAVLDGIGRSPGAIQIERLEPGSPRRESRLPIKLALCLCV